MTASGMRAKPETACRLRVGTSGYSYAEWTEAGFYPPGMSAARMLPCYAGIFGITELNYTWYQMPKAESIERMRRLVGPEFSFAAKLTRTMTHEVDPDDWPNQVIRYRDGIAPLLQSGQLAAVLIQLPPFFDRSKKNRYYLSALLDRLEALPLAVEFRHPSWAVDRVFEELSRRRITLAAVDAPSLARSFPPLDVVTNPDFFYVRFHGRNGAGWRTGHMQKQFDHDYTEAELQEWISPRIAPMARRAETGLLFFNNHVRAQAPRNAQMLIRLLTEVGFTVTEPPPVPQSQLAIS
jgi:uncharacterized protein YecE (DUF72 family)